MNNPTRPRPPGRPDTQPILYVPEARTGSLVWLAWIERREAEAAGRKPEDQNR